MVAVLLGLITYLTVVNSGLVHSSNHWILDEGRQGLVGKSSKIDVMSCGTEVIRVLESAHCRCRLCDDLKAHHFRREARGSLLKTNGRYDADFQWKTAIVLEAAESESFEVYRQQLVCPLLIRTQSAVQPCPESLHRE